jgi:chitinase
MVCLILISAFANIDPSTLTITLGDRWADIEKPWPNLNGEIKGNIGYMNQVLKRENPNLKTLISVGGWTWSGSFSKAAATESSRTTFAQSCLTFVQKYGFDGLDIDWEYPVKGGLESNIYHPDDGVNFSKLLKKIRELFNQANPNLLLTAALSASPDIIKYYEVPELNKYLDFANIMTYDYRGSWDKYTGHQTPLFQNMNDPLKGNGLTAGGPALQLLRDQGMDPKKLTIGIAMYGRSFGGVPNVKNGLFQEYRSIPNNNGDATGVFDYKVIMAMGIPHYWDDSAKSTWGYDPNREGGFMVSFDSVRSVGEKCSFVGKNGFGGFMFWEISGDIPSGSPNSLLDVIFNYVKSTPMSSSISTPNLLNPVPEVADVSPKPDKQTEPSSPPAEIIPLETTSITVSQPSSLRIIGYFASWDIYARQYYPTSIPASKLTHLNYGLSYSNISICKY